MSEENTTEKNTISDKKNSKIRYKFLNYFFRNSLVNIIRLCYSLHEKLNKQLNSATENQLEDFSPVVLTNDDDKYSHIIKEAIENKNVKNLALTGPHSSGKSTILKTFEYNHKEYKYLDISLATFNGEKFESEDIERNILKQLFYSVEHKKIPESRIKRIENIKRIHIKTFLFLLWLASSSYFFKIEFINKLKTILHLNFYNKTLSIVYSIYFIIGFVYLLNKFLNFILNFKLTKFKFNDVDFDDNQDKKTINFENEIDEIIYFFEMNKIDIVFIQDLDRFNESEIFIKLREINNLINNYEPIKKIRKITFIYAISDDVFKNDERTKFFDLIIPVIPVINYSNSSSKLLEKLSDDISNSKLSKEFIDDVSLFINDYRAIKSIINEYNVYKKIIGKELENYNNLLAIMIYKNIEPKDFEKLNKNKGYVFEILNNSYTLISKNIEDIDKKISISKELIEKIKNENLKNILDLNKIYIFTFIELNKNKNNRPFHDFSLKNTRISLSDIVTVENFNQFRNESNIAYFTDNYGHSLNNSNISFKEIDEVFPEKYSERIKKIDDSDKQKLNTLKENIEKLEMQKNEIYSKKLHEIIDAKNSIEYFNNYSTEQEINNLNLTNYLLMSGFINEDYNHYISYFHPGSITKEDNDFLISQLPSQKSLPYNYKLYEFNSIVNKIKLADYSKVSILNFSLLDYLIEINNHEKINLIIKLLKKQSKNSIPFIDQYLAIANDYNKAFFLTILSDKFSDFWTLIILNSGFSAKKIDLYLKYLFTYINDEIIQKNDKNNILANYISKLETIDFLDENIKIESFKRFLKNSSVEFENLKYKEEQKDIFEFIYEEYIYHINYKMIELFISDYYSNNEIIEKFKNSNYTTIKNSTKQKLIMFIDDNIESYLNNVLLKIDNNFNESQESILSILNNDKVTEKTKIAFIEKIKFSIKDLSKVKEIKIQNILLTHNKSDINWANVINYYSIEKKLNNNLIEYLNSENNYRILSKNKINYENLKIKKLFIRDLVESDEINIDSYSQLIKSINDAFEDGTEFNYIDDSRMQLLIKSKIIKLSIKNFNMIHEHFSNLNILFLEKNINDFMKNHGDYNLDSSIILGILNSKVFNQSKKNIIIQNTDENLLMSNKELILKLRDFLLDYKINISQKILEEIIQISNDFNKNVQITNLYFDTFKKENIRNIISQIGLPISKLLLGKHVEIENTVENQKLISNLKKYIISSTKDNDKKNTVKLIPFKNLTI